MFTSPGFCPVSLAEVSKSHLFPSDSSLIEVGPVTSARSERRKCACLIAADRGNATYSDIEEGSDWTFKRANGARELRTLDNVGGFRSAGSLVLHWSNH